MKKVFVMLILAALLSSPSFAGINIFGNYSLADKTEASFASGPINGSIAFKHGAGLGIGAEYSDQIAQEIGYRLGGTYLLDRSITSCTTTSGTCTITGAASIGAILLFGNIDYNFSPEMYVYGGLNYSLPRISGTNFTNAKVAGKPGIQLGVGYKIQKELMIEGSYRIINIDYTDPGFTTQPSNTTNTGFDVSVKYSL